jgi:DNA-binding GntR family transcriptional regulator
MEQKPFQAAIRHRLSLADEVYVALREAILSGEIEDGERIPLEQMAGSFGVSATPIREALVRLEGDGLVQRAPHRGYVVAAVWDSRSFDQMQEMRVLAEPYAASMAARRVREHRVDPGVIDKLADDLKNMALAVKDSGRARSRADSFRGLARYDKQFHEGIADACENPLLSELIRRLRPHPRLVKLYSASGVPPETITEHQAVLDAIRQGDEGAAEKAMKEHLVSSYKRQMPWTVAEV